MRVTFYKTTAEGIREIGSITREDGVPVGNGGLGDRLVELLLGDIDPNDTDAVKAAMRGAPERFDGAYLRATFEEDQEAA